jgi:hypothetical protein
MGVSLFDLYLIIFSTIILSAPIHELGHLVVGLACGWRFEWIVCYCVVVYKHEGKLKISVVPKGHPLRLVMGMAGVSPETAKEFNRYPLVIAAGQLAVLLFAIILFAAGVIRNDYLTLIYVIGPLVFFVIGSFPFKTLFARTDAECLIRCFKGGRHMQEDRLLFQIRNQILIGKATRLNKDEWQLLRTSEDTVTRYCYSSSLLSGYILLPDIDEAVLADAMADAQQKLDKLLADNKDLQKFHDVQHNDTSTTWSLHESLVQQRAINKQKAIEKKRDKADAKR